MVHLRKRKEGRRGLCAFRNNIQGTDRRRLDPIFLKNDGQA